MTYLFLSTVVYFEKGGDDVHHVRTFAELVTVPDPEILMENIVGKLAQ